MFRNLLFVVYLVFVGSICASGSVQRQFDPGYYLSTNELVVVGVLISDSAVDPPDRIERMPNWYYPTNRGCVVIEQVLQQAEGLFYVPGDTVCFRYRTNGTARNADSPELAYTATNSGSWALGVPVGRRGMYGLRRLDDEGLRRGVWFSLTDSLENEILEILVEEGVGPPKSEIH